MSPSKHNIVNKGLIAWGIALFTLVFMLLVKVILDKIHIVFFPLMRISGGLALVLFVLMAVVGSIVFMIVSLNLSAPYVFVILGVSAIAGPLFFFNSPLRFLLMTTGLVIVWLGSVSSMHRYRWVYLGGALLFVVGMISLFWFYPRPWLWSVVIVAVALSTMFVFRPIKPIKLAASFWSLSFPGTIMLFVMILSGRNFYITDANYQAIQLASPINDTHLKVVMIKTEAMIDQILTIRVYQPIGVGLYKEIGYTYFEYYDALDFDIDDFVWEQIEDTQYRLVIDGDFASIHITF